MKITDVTFEEYRWPRPKPITNGKHTYTHAGLTLVEIETDAEIMASGSALAAQSSAPRWSTSRPS